MPGNLRMPCAVHRNSPAVKKCNKHVQSVTSCAWFFPPEKLALCKYGQSCDKAHATKF